MAKVLFPSTYRNGVIGLGLGVLLIGGAVAAACSYGHHIQTALKGPTRVKLEDIAPLEDPGQLPSTWVRVKIEKSVKSTVVVDSRPAKGGISRVSEEFLIFQAGDRWMIAGVPRGFKGKELSGSIGRLSDEASQEAVANVALELESTHRGKLFPFEFDAGEHYGEKWLTLGGLMLLAAVGGIVFCYLGASALHRSRQAPDPLDYGLDPADYRDMVIETPADAKKALARFARDAGHTPAEDHE